MRTIRTLMATLTGTTAVLLALSADLRAQSYGMFGPRVMGNTLQPPASQFGGGLQFTPYGALVGPGRANRANLPNGGNMFATPWRRPYEPPMTFVPAPYTPSAYAVLPTGQLPAGVPAEVPIAPNAPQTVPTEIVPAVPAESELPPPTEAMPAAGATPEGQFPAGNVPMGQPGATGVQVQPTMAPTGGAATSMAPPQRPAFQFVTAPGAATSESYGYLPTVSAHLTQIARDHGIAVPSGIQVYMSNGTAILRGSVISPHEQQLVANLAGLEPGIWRVASELTVASPVIYEPLEVATRPAAP
jgi:hypothetical protein